MEGFIWFSVFNSGCLNRVLNVETSANAIPPSSHLFRPIRQPKQGGNQHLLEKIRWTRISLAVSRLAVLSDVYQTNSGTTV